MERPLAAHRAEGAFVAQDVYQHTFPNGLTLLAERMEHVRSAAVNVLVPAGCVYDPLDQLGLGAMLADLITRGAGNRDSRELTLALDNLGLDRSESVGGLHTRFYGATLARNLPAALEIYADIIRRPHLPDDEMDAVRSLALQDLQGLEDEPRQKVLIELRKRHHPAPLSNDRRGTVEGVNAVTPESMRTHYRKHFQPAGMIMSVAGSVEWEPLRDQVGRLFGDWQGEAPPAKIAGPSRSGFDHVSKEATQTQIAIAYASVPIGHADYYAALGAINVLSGGMSSRLFTQVREERGLCYSIWATYQSFKDRASVIAYAGSTNERAQETLDVTLRELKRLREGIEDDELDRVKAGLKSSLIMAEESTSSRAGSLASDWYYLGRVRSTDEIQKAIDGMTPKTLLEHVERYPAKDFCIVTLGPQPLKVNN
jgi:predicted Zn-dependent peptidase